MSRSEIPEGWGDPDRELPAGLYITIDDGPNGIAAEVRSMQSGGEVLWSSPPIAWTFERDLELARTVAVGAARLWALDYAEPDRSEAANDRATPAPTEAPHESRREPAPIAGEIDAHPARFSYSPEAPAAVLERLIERASNALLDLVDILHAADGYLGALVSTRSSPETGTGSGLTRGTRTLGTVLTRDAREPEPEPEPGSLCWVCKGRGMVGALECDVCEGMGGIPGVRRA